MRRLFLRVCASVAGTILAAAQGSDVKTISTEELKKMVEEKKTFFFLDVREPKELEELGTMEGYVNIPLSQVESRLKEIPKDALIVTA